MSENLLNPNKKICYISYFNVRDGRVMSNQVFNTLTSLGVYCNLYLLTHFIGKNEFIKRVGNYGVSINFKLVRLPVLPAKSFIFQQINRFFYSFFSIFYLKFHKFDYIYTRDFAFIYFLSFLPNFLKPKCPVIFEAHKIFHKVSNKVNFAQEERAYDVVDLFVATSENCKKDLASDFSIKKENILVAPNGVNVEHFQRQSFDKKILKKYSLSDKDKILVYSGSFLWWKGVDDLVRAMKYVKIKNAKLLLIGGYGKEYDEMVELVKKEKLEKKIVFTGYLPQSEMIDLLYCSKIAIIPNNKSEEGENYTSPIKLFEYMSCGLPIIASDLKAMRAVLKEKKNGMFFQPEDEKDLAEKIDNLLNDEKLMELMSKNNKRDVKQYTWEEKAREINIFLD